MAEMITFLGGDSRVGCSMLVHAAAEALTAQKKKVLVIGASGKFGDDFFQNREKKSVDDLRANLISGNLEEEELREVLVKEKDYWILPDVRDPVAAAYYPENCWDPLRHLTGDFDHVLFDAGSDVRLGTVISALTMAEERYFVVTQQEKTVNRFRCASEKVLKPLGLTGKLVVNQYQKAASLASSGEISRFTGYAVGGVIPFVNYGWQAELEHCTLMGNGRYARGVRQLAAQLGREEGRTGRRKEKRGWIGNLISRNI